MELLFRLIRRLLLIIEWILAKVFNSISSRLPFWKIKPAAKIFNAVNFPHQSPSGTLSRGVWIFGRVLSERKTTLPTTEDSNWINFKRMASQWFTREVPHTGITIRIGAQEHQIHSDEEGYFELLTHDVTGAAHISLDNFPYEAEVHTTGICDIPEYIIISDVDDTLLETGAVSLGKMLKTTLLSNSLTRDLVPGMSELINELHQNNSNPVFYVTSSPWNLHLFLNRVFERAKLPKGGLFMTDWGLTPAQWLTPSHYRHKGNALNRINKWYPQSDIILFGDDSQKDHRIYAGFIRMYPNKVKAAFIRQVASEDKRNEVHKVIQKLHDEIGKEIMFSISNTYEIRSILQS